MIILKEGFAPPEDGVVENDTIEFVQADENVALVAGGDEEEFWQGGLVTNKRKAYISK